jgi:hypothetical protein
VIRRSWTSLILLTAACGYITGSETDASLTVAYHGAASTLLPGVVELQVQTEHRSYQWIGGISATPDHPQEFSPVGLHGGDTLSAVAILRTSQGVEITRTVTGIRIQSHWLYGVGFQAGGINPDATGFCHHTPSKVAIPGFPGDTLFVWTSALPEDAVC